MAQSPGQYFQSLIVKAKQQLTNVQVMRHSISQNRAVLDFEGYWHNYRIIVQEIQRVDASIRYAYYVLDKNNNVICGFDNSPDRQAIQLKYGANWKSHRYEETPHWHDIEGNISLTPTPMTFELFVAWLINNLTPNA